MNSGYINLLSKSWFSLRAVGPTGRKLGQVRVKWLCQNQKPWVTGILEYWVWRIEIYFFMDDTDQKLKSGRHPLFIPIIPFFHHSIIPLVI